MRSQTETVNEQTKKNASSAHTFLISAIKISSRWLKRFGFAAIAFLTVLFMQPHLNARVTQINSIATIINDMIQGHQSKPRGVPDHYDWAQRPLLQMGNQPGNFRAIIGLGNVYEAAEGNPAINTRVQIKNLKVYVRSKQQRRWLLVKQSVGVEGAAYRADFLNNISRPGDLRREADGSVSVRSGNGYNFHFWNQGGRAPIDPTDVGGVFITAQARLIVDDRTKLDDRARARYVMSVGGDYWLSTTAPWDNFRTNGGIGGGRFKYVTSQWQAFNLITIPPNGVRQSPPPLE